MEPNQNQMTVEEDGHTIGKPVLDIYYPSFSGITKTGLSSFAQKKEDIHQRIEACSKLLGALGPFRFFVTLTFQGGISKEDAIFHGSKLHRRVLRVLFGKRWKRKGLAPLQGVVITERASIHKWPVDKKVRRKRGALDNWKSNYHFHILIRDHFLLSRCDEDAVEAIQTAYSKSIRRFYKPGTSRELVTRNKGVLVKLVYDEEHLMNYCMKDAAASHWRWDDWVSYLSAEGF